MNNYGPPDDWFNQPPDMITNPYDACWISGMYSDLCNCSQCPHQHECSGDDNDDDDEEY